MAVIKSQSAPVNPVGSCGDGMALSELCKLEAREPVPCISTLNVDCPREEMEPGARSPALAKSNAWGRTQL